MIRFSMKHCQVEKAYSPSHYISQVKSRIRIFVPSQWDSQAHFVRSFLLRGKILTLFGSGYSTQSFRVPWLCDHTILILYTQRKALVNSSSPFFPASLSIKDFLTPGFHSLNSTKLFTWFQMLASVPGTRGVEHYCFNHFLSADFPLHCHSIIQLFSSCCLFQLYISFYQSSLSLLSVVSGTNSLFYRKNWQFWKC